QGGGQRHPQRNGGHRTDEFDQTLNDGIDNPAVQTGKPAQHQPDQQADGDADQTNRQRDASAHDDAAEQIAPEVIGPQQIQRPHVLRLDLRHAEQMQVGVDQPPQPIRVPAHKEPNRVNSLGILNENALEIDPINFGFQPVDDRAAPVALRI